MLRTSLWRTSGKDEATAPRSTLFVRNMMQRADREARLERAKAIGRIAYLHVRGADIFGNISVDGEEKRLRELEEDGLAIDLAAPFRAYARPAEFSRLRIRVQGEKVFEVRWDKAGGFKVVHYDQGDWKRTLRGWPAPIPM
jgi:hypothetical protein